MRISVELDRSDPLPDGRVMVKLVFFRGGRARWSSGIHVDPSPKAWDKIRRRVRAGQRDGIARNKSIDEAIARAEMYVAANPTLKPGELRELMKQPVRRTDESLADALDAHHERHKTRYKYGTRRQNKAAISYVRRAIPNATLEGFSRLDAVTLVNYLLSVRIGPGKKPMHSNTRRSKLRKINTLYCGACDDYELTSSDVFKGLIPPEIPTIKRFAKENEVDALEAFTSNSEAERLSVHTWLLQYHLGGIRIGDACRLHEDMIESNAFQWIEGKVPKPRYHPINPEARAIIDLYKGRSGGFILPHLHEGLTEDQTLARIEGATQVINHCLESICKRLGIKKLTTHNARHTAAKRIKSLTGDIHVAKRILGHAKISQTEVYLDGLDTSEVDEVFKLMRRKQG